MFVHGLLVVTSMLVVGATGEIRRTGWLDRVVLYHKNKFIAEVNQLAPINIQASIEEAPTGYVDSPAWDFDSVARLLALMRASEKARPVRASLRRMLAPTARRFMTREKSYKFFPSLNQNLMNNIYYDDLASDEYYEDSEESVPGAGRGVPPDSAVVVVRNPVEARLPSARISVKLLRRTPEA